MFNPNTSSDVLWSNFNRLMGKRRNGQRGLQIDNSFTQDTSVITEHFANYFYQASSGNSSTDQESGETGWDQNIQVSENTRLDTDFTIYELLRAIDVTNGHYRRRSSRISNDQTSAICRKARNAEEFQ